MKRKLGKGWLVMLLAGIVLLVLGTFSRSASLGFALGALVVCVLSWPRGRYRQLAGIGAAFLIVVAGGLYLARNTFLVHNALYHTDKTSTSVQSSDDQRQTAEASALSDIRREPFGRGPGTAGPASRRLKHSPGRISENYYLQIGQEVGVVGVLLFVTIIAMVGGQLLKLRQDPAALGLLASLVGVSLVGFFLHMWADEDVALVWWGFAGLYLGASELPASTRQSKR